jgi:hypothetical protein
MLKIGGVYRILIYAITSEIAMQINIHGRYFKYLRIKSRGPKDNKPSLTNRLFDGVPFVGSIIN